LRISLLDLGLRDYGEVLKIQHNLVEQRKESKIPDTLILVEHPDVITLGRRGTMENVLSKKFPVYSIERGGDATYHGQGQLVGYPIIRLQEAMIDVVTLVRKIEEVLIKTASDFGITAGRSEKKPGLWVDGKKLASIGIAVQHCKLPWLRPQRKYRPEEVLHDKALWHGAIHHDIDAKATWQGGFF